MKKIILTICVLGFGLSLASQETKKQGEITYEETVKLNLKVDGLSEEILKMMPKETKSKKLLYFNEESSSYQNSKEKLNNNKLGSIEGGIHMMMGQSDEKMYLNFKDNQQIEQKEFMSRSFLIKSTLTKHNWKLSGNQKIILDYPCQEASQIIEGDTIIAWFAPSIPVSAGPANYVNLPGLVLEANINNGKKIIIAQEINLKKIDKKLIAKPKKGKKVSRDEFEKIKEKKLKEMGADSEGSTVIIKASNLSL